MYESYGTYTYDLYYIYYYHVDFKEKKVVSGLDDIKNNLAAHGLWDKNTTVLDDVTFDLPKLHGKSVTDHFYSIANQQLDGYIQLTQMLMGGPIPPKPKVC